MAKMNWKKTSVFTKIDKTHKMDEMYISLYKKVLKKNKVNINLVKVKES